METRQSIDQFFASEKIAIAGVSRNERKFGTVLCKEMKEKGLNVVGVNPHMDTIMGLPCYKGIKDLPADTEALLTVVRPEKTLELIKDAEQRGIRRIWMQQGSQSEEAIKFCQDNGLNYIARECVLMYCEPVRSVHRFHRGLKKLFQGYHKAIQ